MKQFLCKSRSTIVTIRDAKLKLRTRGFEHSLSVIWHCDLKRNCLKQIRPQCFFFIVQQLNSKNIKPTQGTNIAMKCIINRRLTNNFSIQSVMAIIIKQLLFRIEKSKQLVMQLVFVMAIFFIFLLLFLTLKGIDFFNSLFFSTRRINKCMNVCIYYNADGVSKCLEYGRNLCFSTAL